MTNLTTSRFIDPFQDIRREFDQLFERFLGEGYTPLPIPVPTSPRALVGGQQLVPQIDMRMDKGQLVIEADLPGVSPDEVDITLQDGMLTIRGEREDEHVENRGSLHIKERRFGEFERRIRLPEGIDENSMQASFENGVLKVTAQMKPGIGQQRRIEISNPQPGQTKGKISQAGQAGSSGEEQQRAQGQSGAAGQPGKEQGA
jgi:HSP20 family protein